MKYLGIRGALLLLTLLAGHWTAVVTNAQGAKVQGHDNVPYEDHHERGDVPGWVMITLMSAVLVAGLLALAGPALETMFNQAMDKVGK